MKVMIVIGTRPQIIKSAPIITRAREYSKIELSVIHTGQHYDYEMSKVFFNELSLPDPIVNLNIGSGSHTWQIANMMLGLERIYNELSPDIVLVPGDTNSTLAGALTAVKMGISTFHIESGARSGDTGMPEEINRKIVDHISTRLYAVSENCVNNLLKEDIYKGKICLIGDTMYESILQHSMDINKEKSFIKYGLEHKKYCVLTLHREENVSDLNKLMTIVKALSGLDIKIIFPCHPRTKQKLDKHGLKTTFELLKPLPYYEMLSLVQGAGAVITDSGGLQKEAYWLGTPCVTLRDSTEWVETIRSGANCLVDSNPDKIVTGVKTALKNGFQDNGSDNGLLIRDASQKILDDILKFWGMNYD